MTKSSLSIWHYVVSVKSAVKISSTFVAFLENTNFKNPTVPIFSSGPEMQLKCIKLADLKQVETCIKLAPSIFITNNKILIDKSEYSGFISRKHIRKENEVKTWHLSWIVHIIFIFFDDCFNDTKSYSIMAW